MYSRLDTLSTQLPWTQLILFLIKDLVIRLILVVCLKLFALVFKNIHPLKLKPCIINLLSGAQRDMSRSAHDSH